MIFFIVLFNYYSFSENFQKMASAFTSWASVTSGKKPQSETPPIEKPPSENKPVAKFSENISNTFWSVPFHVMCVVIQAARIVACPNGDEYEEECLLKFLELTHEFPHSGAVVIRCGQPYVQPPPTAMRLMLPHVREKGRKYREEFGDFIAGQLSDRFFPNLSESSTPYCRHIVNDFVKRVFEEMFTVANCLKMNEEALGKLMRDSVFVCTQIGTQSNIPQTMLKECLRTDMTDNVLGHKVKQWIANKK